MEALMILLIVGLPICLVVWLIGRAVSARNRIEELGRRVAILEVEVHRLQAAQRARTTEEPAPAAQPAVPQAAPTEPARPVAATIPPVAPVVPAAPPPLPPLHPPAPAPLPFVAEVKAPEPEVRVSTPPTVAPLRPPPAKPFVPKMPEINWEQFMGVKLFAWVGGLALFLGVAFFVKYSFDNNLVPPQLRVALGFLTGIGLLVGGVAMSKKEYPALSQTFCATGTLILYATTFACKSVYHFQFFDTVPTFLLMVLITATAFLLAVRLDAMVVAILGMLGGFLTPVLLSTGVDNPLGLFGYIAILDVGLILVALNRKWHFLAPCSALGTIIMQAGWAGEFFTRSRYFEGSRIFIPMAVFLGFNLLYLATSWWNKRRDQANLWISSATLALSASGLIAGAVWVTGFHVLAVQPWLLFSYVFLVDAAVAALILLDTRVAPAQPVAGLLIFVLLGSWTAMTLTNNLLNAALVFYLVFAVGHSVFPILLKKLRGVGNLMWGTQVFPPLALALIIIPILGLENLSVVIWPFVLLLDLLAIGLAVLTASLAAIVAVLLLTIGATAAMIMKVPLANAEITLPLILVGAFAVFFVAVSVWIARRFKPAVFGESSPRLDENLLLPENIAGQLPILSACLPFLLLIMATVRLPMPNPAPVFGLGLLLLVLLLGVTRLFSLDWMPVVGLGCIAALEYAWHFNRFGPAQPVQPLGWYLLFLALFLAFPFVFLRQFRAKSPPWIAAALAPVAQFYLVYRLVGAAWPNHIMGLVPAAFVLPPLAALVLVLRHPELQVSPKRMTQLALFGGSALFFITLIFPIQWERQWLTIAWALEGAALLWLFHRVPHEGLRITGCTLLVVSFVRLVFNPAVLGYHPRSETPILNWYLYSYGIVTICLYLGARLLAPPHDKLLQSNVRALLASLGTILAFVLLNIEIADYFSQPGSTLTFEFTGNFARDMTYSIAWALFALGLLIFGIARKVPTSRYAGLALLSVTVLKLFLHDLANLGQLYRIGAFIGVAIIAMLASFAYHRFFAATAKAKLATDESPAR